MVHLIAKTFQSTEPSCLGVKGITSNKQTHVKQSNEWNFIYSRQNSSDSAVKVNNVAGWLRYTLSKLNKTHINY